ncbi:MAG: IS3 family transposase [Telluria sp.]
MKKHTQQFKLAVVQHYLNGVDGYETVAQHHDVGRALVRRWVAFYRSHGVDGLKHKHTAYTADFKLSALQHMWENKLSYAATAAIFNIRGQCYLGIWERCYREGGIDALTPRPRRSPPKMPDPNTSNPPAPMPAPTDETRSRDELVAELNYLRMENAYLKKLKALVQADQQAAAARKTQVVQELRLKYPVEGLLKLACLKRSTFYYQRKVAELGDRYAELKLSIRTIYAHHKGRYGYRRITAALREKGAMVTHNTVQRLMVEMGIKSLVRVKKYSSYKGEVGTTAPNLLLRNFEAAAIDEKWVTDVTEFKVAGSKLFLSPIMDLCSGEIIAYESDTRPSFGMVVGMLKKAFATIGCDRKPILHSDQGWQYRMPAYQAMLKDKNINQSMSRKGNCLDNAAMESFFAVLKTEFFYLNKFTSVEHLREGNTEYIHYYNHERIKTRLKGKSPVQYRTLLALP